MTSDSQVVHTDSHDEIRAYPVKKACERLAVHGMTCAAYSTLDRKVAPCSTCLSTSISSVALRPT